MVCALIFHAKAGLRKGNDLPEATQVEGAELGPELRACDCDFSALFDPLGTARSCPEIAPLPRGDVTRAIGSPLKDHLA